MAALPSWLVTRARAVSAGLGGDIAAPTVQRDMAWALQFRNTSCLSPQPEPAWTASKAHSVPELLHQKPCSISPHPLSLQHRCSSTATSCPILLSPIKATAFAKPFTAVLNQPSSSLVLPSIHMLFCPLSAALGPSREA